MKSEPGTLEVWLTVALGATLVTPYYRSYVQSLPLAGGEHILDYGSGSGVCSRLLAERLQERGGRLTCLDVAERWLRAAQWTMRGHANVDYRLGAIQDAGLADATFDAVFIHFVLHDVPAAERAGVCWHLARVLQPGGALFLREPTAQHGMPAAEVRRLMLASGLREESSATASHRLAGPTYQAIYRKAG